MLQSVVLDIFTLLQELMMIHSAQHLEDLKELVSLVSNPETLEEAKLKCISKYQGVYVNEKTLDCTRMAAAAVIDLAEAIVKGRRHF
jgi:acetoin utilization deacetylase AcuC-like enzyme